MVVKNYRPDRIEMTAAAFRRRLMKEREELSSKPPLGISLDESATGDSLTRYIISRVRIRFVYITYSRWVVRVDGAEGMLADITCTINMYKQ